MKKIVTLLISTIIVTLLLTACGNKVIKENIEINYNEIFIAENEAFKNYEDLSWKSENEEIVITDKQNFTGIAPGETKITVFNGEDIVAEYSVEVKIIPMNKIVLSTNELELSEDETYQAKYSLFPENASDYGLTWKSADESVAIVNEYGNITAISEGQTNISLTNNSNIIETISVSVKLKPAYERLSQEEKNFVDTFIKYSSQFKNSNSVKVEKIEFVIDGVWGTLVSAQNGFGGYGSSYYALMEGMGFIESQNSDYVAKYDNSYDIELINEALQEKIS